MTWMRPLGNTGLEVSALGLGTVKLGRDRGVKYPRAFTIPDDRKASNLLAQARDLGINLIDTAPAYGNSEERLGKLLAGQRDQWLICSKAGEEFERGASRFDFSPGHIRRSVQRSLRRLNTDVLDIVLIHSDGNDLDILTMSGAVESLRDLQQEGLVRAVGMSTKTVAGGLAAARVCDVVMLTYNRQQQENSAVLEACAGTGVLIKKALASGHLESDKGDPVQAALGLTLPQCKSGSVLIGTISPQHLEENVQSARAVTD